MPDPVTRSVLDSELRVISAGVQGFADALREQSVPVVELDWQPPADGDPDLNAILARAEIDDGLATRIDEANREVVRRIVESDVRIVDVVSAGDAMGLPDRTVLHSGPPIAWDRMCGPQRRAVAGAIRFEGWAASDEDAEKLVTDGAVQLDPCHRYHAVGPMTGVISPSMPVMVAENATFGTVGFSTLNEGRGNTLWFGVCDGGTLDRLRWFRDELAPALRRGIETQGGLDVFDIISQGIQMGDECHARHAACTTLLVKKLVPSMLDGGVSPKDVAAFVRFAADNNHFFLNFTLAAVKATMDAAHGVPDSTVVTGMSRNGVDFMIRVGGLGHRWIVAPVSPMDEAVYYTGFSLEDAAGDIGDSAIIETCGLGGMAIAAAPTVAPFVGGSLADEIAAVRRLGGITVSEHDRFRIPTMDAMRTPLGIDVRAVVETRIVPFITTGVLHEHSATTGQIGTGVARAPTPVFDGALQALAHEWWGDDMAPPDNAVSIEPAPLPVRGSPGGAA